MFYSDILKENRRQQMDVREAASLRQQRRMKQAVQFIHKDSADLLPLDGLKKLGTSKETQPHNILQRRLLETNLSKFRANNRETWSSNNSFPVQNISFHQTKQEFHKKTQEEDLIFVRCKCAGKEMKVQIDTGSRYNLISSACVDKLGLQELMKTEKEDTEKYGMPFISKIRGQIENVGITLGQLNVECSAAVVDDDDKNTLSLGLQTLRSLKCIIDMEKQYLILGEKEKEEIPFLGIDNIEDWQFQTSTRGSSPRASRAVSPGEACRQQGLEQQELSSRVVHWEATLKQRVPDRDRPRGSSPRTYVGAAKCQ
ncbi:nuclear receptor-interacting protein 3-like [Hemiscyllium ocellatum]|uniref:nuclear receptor-interacting protein 3-like n=1 Tax=Hemiscyllium ocellatum TaxID=170820 RepID=UPI002965D1F1|nr:nuclear receptor-interacting protein 3-like [Hemiscyllium ocellatum]